MSLYPFQLSTVRRPWCLLSQNNSVCSCFSAGGLNSFFHPALHSTTKFFRYSKASTQKKLNEFCRVLNSLLFMYLQFLRFMASILDWPPAFDFLAVQTPAFCVCIRPELSRPVMSCHGFKRMCVSGAVSTEKTVPSFLSTATVTRKPGSFIRACLFNLWLDSRIGATSQDGCRPVRCTARQLNKVAVGVKRIRCLKGLLTFAVRKGLLTCGVEKKMPSRVFSRRFGGLFLVDVYAVREVSRSRRHSPPSVAARSAA